MQEILEIIFSRKVVVPILIIIFSLLIYIGVSKIVKKLLTIKSSNIRINARRHKTLVTLVDNIVKYFITIVALLMILDVYGIDTKSLIASLGVMSLVIGLALQDLLKDIIAGFTIIFEDQYAVGDIVTVGTFKGTVSYLGIKSTRITAYSGEVLILANRNIDKVINHTLENHMSLIDVDVAYESDLPKVREVLNKICEEFNEDKKITCKAEVCGVEKLGDSGITMRIVFGSNYNDRFPYERKLRELIKNTFDEEHIKIPYPQVEVHNGK